MARTDLDQIREDFRRISAERRERIADAYARRKAGLPRPVPEERRKKLSAAAFKRYAAVPTESKLRRARYDAGLRRVDLSELAHVSVPTIQRAERDAASISELSWRRLSAALGVDPDEIKP